MKLSDVMGGDNTVSPTNNRNGDPEITGLTSDSRAVEPGFLFAALAGSHHDGRAFIAEALHKGAAAVLAAPGTQLGDGARARLVVDENPRRRLSQMAARFYRGQPETVVAVTGTNGKTSVVHFLDQIWRRQGLNSATLGTLGVHGGGVARSGSLTTPDAVSLHATLAGLANGGVSHLAMEASSHGLAQYRLDGVRIKGAAFTNLTRDHLDYHRTMPDYLAAKMRLFAELVSDGGFAVVNAAAPQSEAIAQIARRRGLAVISYGPDGADVGLVAATAEGAGQALVLAVRGRRFNVRLPLAGAFQAENALCALALALACGIDAAAAVAALETLAPVPGRLQWVGERAGALVYVDYAHTPDALQTVLAHLKPHATGKLHVVFGAGGDRDPGKRGQMGAIAVKTADHVIVTDDNPRTEDAAAIRGQILARAPGAEEITPRGDAIRAAVAALAAGDVLVIAGKGHEQGQIVGTTTLPFDDAREARAAIDGAGA